MRKLYVGLSTPQKFKVFAALIKLVEGTEYSHVYFQLEKKTLDEDLIYQASSAMVNFMGEDHFYEINRVVKKYEIEISEETYLKFLNKAVHLAGRPYGIKQIFGIAYVRIMERFGREVENPFADQDRTFVCSELAADFLKDLGVEIPGDPDSIGPKHIDLAMQAYIEKLTV